MILHCNFEELRALAAGAELMIAAERTETGAAVAAPAEAIAQLEMLLPRLTADLTIDTLAEQARMRDTVALICENLRSRLEDRVVEYHPAHEEAVSYYFDFAHVRTVLHRLDTMGAEMRALIEVMTGEPATEQAARTFTFPD